MHSHINCLHSSLGQINLISQSLQKVVSEMRISASLSWLGRDQRRHTDPSSEKTMKDTVEESRHY